MTCCSVVLYTYINLHYTAWLVGHSCAVLANISAFKKEQKISKGSALGKLTCSDLITSLSLDWIVDPKVDKAGSRKTENSPTLPLSFFQSGKKCH